MTFGGPTTGVRALASDYLEASFATASNEDIEAALAVAHAQHQRGHGARHAAAESSPLRRESGRGSGARASAGASGEGEGEDWDLVESMELDM